MKLNTKDARLIYIALEVFKQDREDYIARSLQKASEAIGIQHAKETVEDLERLLKQISKEL